MRIGFDARLAWRRGVGVYAAHLLLALSRVDPYNEYHVFSAPGDLRRALPSRRFHFHDPSGVGLSRPWGPLLRHPALYEQVWMPVMLRRHGLDLLHYTDNSGPLVPRIPFVVTVHDTMFLRPLKAAYPHATWRQRLVDLYKKMAAFSARGALEVITVSESSKRDIARDLKVPEDRVRVTPEGVDLREFHPLKRQVRRKGFPTVLVHGAEDARKNLKGILRCAALLLKRGKHIRWNVLGMDERSLARAGLDRWVREWGLAPYLHLSGDIPRDRLKQAYQGADVLLHVSLWEGFGLPVLEAFACGVPVVISDAKALPEVAGGAALIVPPERPEAMADAVLRILGRPALARSLARKGRVRARQFTWDRTARLTLEAYRAALLTREYDPQGRRIGSEEEA